MKVRFYDSMKYEHKPHYFWCAFTVAVPQHCRGWSLAAFAAMSPSGHNSRSNSEPLTEAIRMPVQSCPACAPHTCWQSQHSWLLSLGTAGGRETMRAAADPRDCSGPEQEPPWMAAPTSQPSFPEHLQSPLSPHRLVQRFLHSTVIFCAESQSSPLSLLYPNVTSTVLMLSVCLSLNIFLFIHE